MILENKASDDTVKLLRECSSGAKMGVDTIDGILKYVSNEDLAEKLTKSKSIHTDIENETAMLLRERGETEKEPGVIAESMSCMKADLKLGMHETDNTVADLITEGCNMGIKSLNRYLNQYTYADDNAKGIAKKLIETEEELSHAVKEYL